MESADSVWGNTLQTRAGALRWMVARTESEEEIAPIARKFAIVSIHNQCLKL